MPTTLRRPVCATIPVARIVNKVNVPRRRKTSRSGSNTADHDPGKIMHRTVANRTTTPWQASTTQRAGAHPVQHHEPMPTAIDQATRTTLTRRVTAHVRQRWPHLKPTVRFRGQFCYVDAALPGHRQPTPILRLRYHGSADEWTIGIWLASSESYTESELPKTIGPTTGTPEQGVDHTFILYAGPSTHH
jgi:hypothetical protein